MVGSWNWMNKCQLSVTLSRYDIRSHIARTTKFIYKQKDSSPKLYYYYMVYYYILLYYYFTIIVLRHFDRMLPLASEEVYLVRICHFIHLIITSNVFQRFPQIVGVRVLKWLDANTLLFNLLCYSRSVHYPLLSVSIFWWGWGVEKSKLTYNMFQNIDRAKLQNISFRS